MINTEFYDITGKYLKCTKEGEKDQLIILMNSVKRNLSNMVNKAMELNILNSNNINSFAEESYYSTWKK